MFFTATGFIFTMIGQIFATVLGIQLAGNLTLGGVYVGLLIATVLILLIKEVAGVSSLSMASSGSRDLVGRSNVKKRAKASATRDVNRDYDREKRHQQHRQEHNADRKAHADYTRKLWKK